MSATEKVAIVAMMIGGAVLGYQIAGIAGAVLGWFAGLGVMTAGYVVADEVDTALRRHYRRV